MVFLLTDANEYRELKAPSQVLIGRGGENHFRPESQSVSKAHAVMTVTPIPGTNRVDVWLEDLNSRNGTYCGATPLDLERVNAKVKLYDGDYIRFGHSQKYFRYMVTIPNDAVVLAAPDIQISPSKEFQSHVAQFMNPSARLPQSSASMKQFFSDSGYGSPPRKTQSGAGGRIENKSDGVPINNNFGDSFRPGASLPPPLSQQDYPSSRTGADPAMQRMMSAETVDNMLQPYMPRGDHGGIINNTGRPMDLQLSSAGIADRPQASSERVRRSQRYSEEPDGLDEAEGELSVVPRRAKSAPTTGKDPKNMTISINYPTNVKTQQPVSISIGSAAVDTSVERRKTKEQRPSRSAARRDEDSLEGDDANEGMPKKRSGRSKSPSKRDNSTSSKGKKVPAVVDNSFESIEDDDDEDEVEEEDSEEESLDDRRYATKNKPTVKSGAGSKGSSRSPQRGSKKREPSPPAIPTYPSVDELNAKMFSQPYGRAAAAPKKIYNNPSLRNDAEIFNDDEPDPISKFMTLLSNKAAGITGAGGGGTAGALLNPVRRSWPEGFYPPTSETVARFCDLIVGDDVGATYQNFFIKADPTTKKTPLKKQKTQNLLPPVIPNVIVSEVIAENLSGSRTGVNSKRSTVNLLNASIKELNELLRQSLKGCHIDERRGDKTSAEFDHVLRGVISLTIQGVHGNVTQLLQSSLIHALSAADKNGVCPNKIYSNLQESSDTLARLNDFVMGTYLAEQAQLISSEQNYEILAHSISNVLNKLDACNVAVHLIHQKAEEETVQHVTTHGGPLKKTGLSIELEQLRQLKKESEAGPWLDRIRQQEAGILGKKMSKFQHVFRFAEEFQTKAALDRWKMNVNGLKRHELRVLDLTEKYNLKHKKDFFSKWNKVYRIMRQRRKALHRMARIIGAKGNERLRQSFRQWQKLTEKQLVVSANAQETAALKLEICNLKAKIHDITNKSEIAANLAAERALNRELSAVNLELRHAIQQLENKLLDCAQAPQSKRKDLVYHHLVGKEEELAEAKRESNFLLSELEVLTLITDSHKKVVGSIANMNNPNKTTTLGYTHGTAAVGKRPPVPDPAKSKVESSKVEAFKRAQLAKNNYNAIPPSSGGNSAVMTKEIAKQVILNEVRRLQESHTTAKKHSQELFEKMTEETNKNVQNCLALQSLQSRITTLERSAHTLRELLHQRLGEHGIMELVESLERLGAGAAVLLETPTSESVSGGLATNTQPSKVSSGNPSTDGDRSRSRQRDASPEPTMEDAASYSKQSGSRPPIRGSSSSNASVGGGSTPLSRSGRNADKQKVVQSPETSVEETSAYSKKIDRLIYN